jgi:hypothetical protein
MADTAVKHTPGPWIIDGYGTIKAPNHETVLVEGVALPSVSTVESIANTHLVAAAPDLLEALKALVANLSDGDFISETRIDAARAAIAKATGEA